MRHRERKKKGVVRAGRRQIRKRKRERLRVRARERAVKKAQREGLQIECF